ncbi:MAG: hypothetical protein IAE95_01425 [Chitinophagaceae bacterium]|nr:hypothetical protein [Chitinophagaceae bacterium]
MKYPILLFITQTNLIAGRTWPNVIKCIIYLILPYSMLIYSIILWLISLRRGAVINYPETVISVYREINYNVFGTRFD